MYILYIFYTIYILLYSSIFGTLSGSSQAAVACSTFRIYVQHFVAQSSVVQHMRHTKSAYSHESLTRH